MAIKEGTNPLERLEVVSLIEKTGGNIVVGSLPISSRGKDNIYLDLRALVSAATDETPAVYGRGVTMSPSNIPELCTCLAEAQTRDKYPDDEVLKDLPKNSTNIIRVSLKTFRGKEYVDIRQFYLKDESYKPSPKGITVPPDCIEDLIAGLNKFEIPSEEE